MELMEVAVLTIVRDTDDDSIPSIMVAGVYTSIAACIAAYPNVRWYIVRPDFAGGDVKTTDEAGCVRSDEYDVMIYTVH